MTTTGDALLFAVSAAREMSAGAFRRAYEGTWRPNGDQSDEPLRFAVSAAVGTLDALGHCERSAGGKITAAPALLAVLPWPGMPRAVLCGSRSPETSPILRDSARRYGARVTVAEQGSANRPAPSRIEVRAEDSDEFDRIAEALGCAVARVPPAISIASIAGSLPEYLETLEWVPSPDLNWQRRDFFPERRRFDYQDRYEGPLRLSRYRHPDGYAQIDYLWRGELRAEVDRSWGRFAVLADAGVNVLEYDRSSGNLKVPATTPLPRLFARALCLASGQPPEQLKASPGSPVQCFGSVPAGLAGLVSTKLTGSEPIPTS